MLEWLLIGGPAAGGIATLGMLGWNREMRRRRKKDVEAELARRLTRLTGARRVRPEGESWQRTDGQGQLVLLVVGGYASHQLPYILQGFLRGGTQAQVGIILLVELDQNDLTSCLDSIPVEFRDRVVTVDCPLMSGGGVGDPIDVVTSRSHLWKKDLEDAVRRWLARIEHETRPVLLLALLSTGGMVAMGYPPLIEFHKRYRDLPIFLITMLDQKQVVRERFPATRQLFMSNGLIRGTFLTDNTRHSRESDLSISLLPAAMAGANWIDEKPLAPWNSAAYLFPPEYPGGFATISTWAEMMSVDYFPAWEDVLPEVYYTKGSIFEEKVIRGIKALLESPELQAIPLEPAHKKQIRLIYVTSPLVPDPDLRLSAQRIMDNLEEWRQAEHPQLIINFASAGAPLTPDTKQTPVVITLVQPLADRGEKLDAYAQGTLNVDEKFLPQGDTSAHPPLAQGGTNDHAS